MAKIKSKNLILMCLITSYALFFCLPAYSSHKINFKVDGISYNTFSLETFLFATNAKGAISIEVMDPHQDHKRAFNVLPFRGLMDSLSSILPRKSWDSYEAIVFECEDGYSPIIPMYQFLTYDGFLAYGSADYLPFSLENKLQNEHVDLGSFYLIWDNKTGEETDVPPTESWPYKVVGINLITSIESYFPKTMVPLDAPENVRIGQKEFQNRCLPCHNIKGSGSKKATDLNGVFDRHHISDLQAYINNPRTVNPGSHMPGLDKNLDETEKQRLVLYYLIPYLKEVTK